MCVCLCAGCLQAARCSSLGKLHAVMASHQAHRWDLLTPGVLLGQGTCQPQPYTQQPALPSLESLLSSTCAVLNLCCPAQACCGSCHAAPVPSPLAPAGRLPVGPQHTTAGCSSSAPAGHRRGSGCFQQGCRRHSRCSKHPVSTGRRRQQQPCLDIHTCSCSCCSQARHQDSSQHRAAPTPCQPAV